MRGNAVFFHELEHEVAHAVVHNPFAFNGSLLLPVKSRGIIFIRNNAQVGVIGGKYLFGFSFVHLFHFLHDKNLL